MAKLKEVGLIVGLLSFLFGCGAKDKSQDSSALRRDTVEESVAGSLEVLNVLRDLEVGPDIWLKLEYFYYSETESNAQALADALNERGYSTEYGLSAADDGLYIITGWTDRIRMEDSLVADWTREMYLLGQDHEAVFDGWGTDPTQGLSDGAR